jgi:hypothetical protein
MYVSNIRYNGESWNILETKQATAILTTFVRIDQIGWRHDSYTVFTWIREEDW